MTTPLWIIAGSFGLAFMAGVGACPDGPDDMFWPGVLIFGTIFSAAALVGWAL